MNRHLYERGFALLAVLWVIVALGALAGAGVAGARMAHTVTANRVVLARARWAAEGCLAVVHARLDSLVAPRGAVLVLEPDSLHFANGARCRVAMHDPGALVNPDSVPRATLARLAAAAAGAATPLESLRLETRS